MDKKIILQKIDEAIVKEEMAVPVYANHLSTTLFYSGFDDKTKKIIDEKLKILISDSQGHARALRTVRETIENNK